MSEEKTTTPIEERIRDSQAKYDLRRESRSLSPPRTGGGMTAIATAERAARVAARAAADGSLRSNAEQLLFDERNAAQLAAAAREQIEHLGGEAQAHLDAAEVLQRGNGAPAGGSPAVSSCAV